MQYVDTHALSPPMPNPPVPTCVSLPNATKSNTRPKGRRSGGRYVAITCLCLSFANGNIPKLIAQIWTLSVSFPLIHTHALVLRASTPEYVLTLAVIVKRKFSVYSSKRNRTVPVGPCGHALGFSCVRGRTGISQKYDISNPMPVSDQVLLTLVGMLECAVGVFIWLCRCNVWSIS